MRDAIMSFQLSNMKVYSEKSAPVILHGPLSWPRRWDLFAQTRDIWTGIIRGPDLRVLAQRDSLPEELLPAKLRASLQNQRAASKTNTPV